MLKKALFYALSATLLSTSMAPALAGDADIRKAASEMLRPGTKIDEIRKAEVAGLYEVRIGSNVFYSDEKGAYFIMGDITDTKSKRNLTEERRNKLSAIKWSELPLDQAIKTVRGNGKRVFATFEDPNCGYCKKLAKEIDGMNDFTMYTFLYPILSPDSSEKSKNIWCAADRSKAWMGYMTGKSTPTSANCDTPIEKNLALGQRIGVRGTPHLILINGQRFPGAVSADQLNQMLTQSSAEANGTK